MERRTSREREVERGMERWAEGGTDGEMERSRRGKDRRVD